MKKRMWFGVYVLGMLAYLVWMFASNRIIQGLSENLSVDETSLSVYQSKDPVYCWVDEVQMTGDLFKTMTIRGWAFVETESSNENAYTDVLLVNNRHCYCLENKEFTSGVHGIRADVLEAFPEKRIPHSLIGFINKYSGFMIEDGEYQIYIHRWENENNYGLTKSNAVLYKNGSNVELLYEY